LRKRHVELSENLPKLGLADQTVYQGLAVWADRSQVPDVFIDRHVLSHIARRGSRGLASEAVDFPRFAGPFVSCLTRLKEGTGLSTQNHGRPFSVDGAQSSLDPYPDGILMHGEQAGELFDRVGAVDFDNAGVGMTFSHRWFAFCRAGFST